MWIEILICDVFCFKTLELNRDIHDAMSHPWSCFWQILPVQQNIQVHMMCVTGDTFCEVVFIKCLTNWQTNWFYKPRWLSPFQRREIALWWVTLESLQGRGAKTGLHLWICIALNFSLNEALVNLSSSYFLSQGCTSAWEERDCDRWKFWPSGHVQLLLPMIL